MARIRSIKPEFWKSETIAALSIQTRLTFIGLWSYVDDNGVGRDVEKLIAAEIYPLEDDPRETLAHVQRSLSELSEAGRILRYTCEGKPYLAIVNWTEHQRIDKPNKPRYPEFDPLTCSYGDSRDTLAQPSRDVTEPPAPGAVEVGTGEQRKQEQGKDIAPRPARERDEVWDSLLEACGVDTNQIPSSARGAYNRAVADLKAIGATPNEIRRRAAVFRGQWRDMSLTPTALARRWAECDRPVTTGPAISRNTQLLDAAMERARAAEAQQKAIGR